MPASHPVLHSAAPSPPNTSPPPPRARFRSASAAPCQSLFQRPQPLARRSRPLLLPPPPPPSLPHPMPTPPRLPANAPQPCLATRTHHHHPSACPLVLPGRLQSIMVVDRGPGMTIEQLQKWAEMANPADARKDRLDADEDAWSTACHADGALGRFGQGSKAAAFVYGTSVRAVTYNREGKRRAGGNQNLVYEMRLDEEEMSKRADWTEGEIRQRPCYNPSDVRTPWRSTQAQAHTSTHKHTQHTHSTHKHAQAQAQGHPPATDRARLSLFAPLTPAAVRAPCTPIRARAWTGAHQAALRVVSISGGAQVRVHGVHNA